MLLYEGLALFEKGYLKSQEKQEISEPRQCGQNIFFPDPCCKACSLSKETSATGHQILRSGKIRLSGVETAWVPREAHSVILFCTSVLISERTGQGRGFFSTKAHYERQSWLRRLAAELEVSREHCEMQSRVQECGDLEPAKDRVSFLNSHQSVTEWAPWPACLHVCTTFWLGSKCVWMTVSRAFTAILLLPLWEWLWLP